MATLLENIQTKLDMAIDDDAKLDAAAAAANTTRQEQIDALNNLRDAVAQVPEGLLVEAVQEHLKQVKETVADAGLVPVSGDLANVGEAIDTVIEQVVGDSEQITEAPVAG